MMRLKAYTLLAEEKKKEIEGMIVTRKRRRVRGGLGPPGKHIRYKERSFPGLEDKREEERRK